MNLYNILEVNKDSDITEIKIAYKKLVIKYHPDKNPDIDTTEKFKEIRMAYEILSNKENRKQYDELTNENKDEFYDELKQYCAKKFPTYERYHEDFINIFFDDENELKNDINNYNFFSIFSKIKNKMKIIFENINQNQNPEISEDIEEYKKGIKENLDIIGKIKTNMRDKYNNKYAKINVKRRTCNNIELMVPLRESEIIVQEEGEINKDGKKGDIIINIICEDENINKYKIMNDNDLYREIDISLYNYIYGGKIILDDLSEDLIIHEYNTLIDKELIIKINNKGMPFVQEDEQQENQENQENKDNKDNYIDIKNDIKRGDIILKISIKDIDDKINKEIIKRLFS